MKRISINLIGLTVSLLIVFLIVVGSVYRTRTKPTPFPTNLPLQTPSANVVAEIKDSLLGNSSCSLPCREGITPSVTTSSDALKRLKSLSYIQQKGLQSWGSSSITGAAQWDWKGSVPFYANHPRLSWEAGVINEILLFPPNVSVEEIINRYGLPEKVDLMDFGTPEYVSYSVRLYYTPKGFFIQLNDIPDERDAQLKPSSLITYFVLFKPSTLEEYLLSHKQNTIVSKLPNWKGYGNLYEIYNP